MERDDYPEGRSKNTEDLLLFAALLLNRFDPMAPHHVAALRERLGYKTDVELQEFIRKGKFQ